MQLRHWVSADAGETAEGAGSRASGGSAEHSGCRRAPCAVLPCASGPALPDGGTKVQLRHWVSADAGETAEGAGSRASGGGAEHSGCRRAPHAVLPCASGPPPCALSERRAPTIGLQAAVLDHAMTIDHGSWYLRTSAQCYLPHGLKSWEVTIVDAYSTYTFTSPCMQHLCSLQARRLEARREARDTTEKKKAPQTPPSFFCAPAALITAPSSER